MHAWSLFVTVVVFSGPYRGIAVHEMACFNTLCFFYKNLFCKNVEAEINQNFKNILRTFLRLRVD